MQVIPDGGRTGLEGTSLYLAVMVVVNLLPKEVTVAIFLSEDSQ